MTKRSITLHFKSEKDYFFMGTKITKIGITNDKISARGGLTLFLRYVEQTGLYNLILGAMLPYLIKSTKGLQLQGFLKQILAFFIDGTDISISGFDQRKKDEGYIALLENSKAEMASSHQIKRYFSKISIVNDLVFNKILHELFIWRIKITKPAIIELGIDTMVMDNDYAKKREGNKLTYKKKNGFQPLHISWGSFLIDVLFRAGDAHSNHGTDYTDRVRAIVKLIRKRYSKDAPIIICADSGFADQKAYLEFEENLGIHYITTSRMYKGVKEYMAQIPVESFAEFSKKKAIWRFVEFGNKLVSWTRFRRCIYTDLTRDENGQYLMGLKRTDSFIYTNIGTCPVADKKLKSAGGEHYFETETIIHRSHQRGADELIHRSIKELATKEQLPFKKFGMNRAYYFLLVITHFFFETYKQDIAAGVISIAAYPNTFRRKLIDFAVKITSGARYITLNVTRSIYQTINIAELWKRCQSPPKIQVA
ncbi:MAG: IS1380 family transposase [Flavobacterium sp.]|nr:IS1380 family transposase [Flavobacterium sp.]